MKAKKVIFSGIQPTGGLHLGNFLGAIKNWRKLQNDASYDKYTKLFCIVDHHALSNKFSIDHQVLFKTDLAQQTLELTAGLLACGIDPKKCNLFLQNHVPSHTEFMWLLSCIAPHSWLNRMTQYKDKRTKNSSLGLYSYPV
jgi:tryptophanyl-tRNA synthetase